MRQRRFRKDSNKPRTKYATNSNGEAASPWDSGKVLLRDYIETATKSGPVKTWAEMTPEQRQRVLAQLKPSGTR